MRRRIISLGLFIMLGLGILVAVEPRQLSAASAQSTAGTIAYVVPNDTTGDEIWLTAPNGTNNRKIFSVNKADPYHVQAITDLAWRPDGTTLAFASNHEEACSWLASDIYAIQADGTGYRRVTNSPNCAALANYPKGNVTVGISGGGFYQIYVQGAPGLQSVLGGYEVTFSNVADLGNVFQPAVAIDGEYRAFGAGVDVKAGQTVDAGILDGAGWGFSNFGIYKLNWNRDGTRIGYALSCSQLYGISASPTLGSIGQPLINVPDLTPCVMAWGSTPSTANQILYFTQTEEPGIYLTTEGSTSVGTKLVSAENWDTVFDIQYLPDGSGFIYSMTGYYRSQSNLYRYDFASGQSIPLTNFSEKYARSFGISPDAQNIIFGLTTNFYSDYDASELWTVGMNGSGLQLFASNGAHPTWKTNVTPPLQKLYLPLVVR